MKNYDPQTTAEAAPSLLADPLSLLAQCYLVLSELGIKSLTIARQ